TKLVEAETGCRGMGNSFQVEVSESREELQHRLRHAVTGTTKERLQMLYWLKVGANAYGTLRERNKTGTVAAARTRSINCI
ncbi:MAG: hypothetical protein V7L04_17935, partial [Nostoc sp.]